MDTPNKSKKLTHVEVLVIGLLCLFIIAIALSASDESQAVYFRQVCMSNLSGIGTAMLIYANDYDDQLPRAGGITTTWGMPVTWDAIDRYRAYGLAVDGSGGRATISSSLYLLVKYTELMPKDFVCPGDTGTTEFKLSDYPYRNPSIDEYIYAWDFGLEAWKHCSYAYHMPYGLYSLTTSNKPGMAVAADRNPWIKSPALAPKPFFAFKPDIPPRDGTAEQGRYGNANAHGEDGQNVLFLDGHVSFEERSYCGLEDDNIYTFLPGNLGHPQLGVPPIAFVSVPGHIKDSLLVHDPALDIEQITKEPVAIDSNNLKQTSVVATLDCSIPEHQNAIWCSTFQIAWNELKDGIIGEPIEVIGAEELAAHLNQAGVSEEDLEEESYYATAGFVKDGIIEQIQNQMSELFPSEPIPEFNGQLDPNAIIAYSYLNVDVDFGYPFHVYKYIFNFVDSNGTSTGVTAFCIQSGQSDPAFNEVLREQVEILYYKFGDGNESDEFAVDLCKYTSPYQIVLASIPRSNTLSEAVAKVEQNISEFKNDPNYEVLHKLKPMDSLIVPDILYKLTHKFEALLDKHLGNPKWLSYFFSEAMQMIDFSLSRTGVIIKSAAYSPLPPGRYIEEPRRFHFDRPFLIYVKKREGGISPFFVMWVDNAELMNEFQ